MGERCMFRIVLLAALLCAAGAPVAGTANAAQKLYDDTGNPANTYYSAQGGAEALDDLHMNAAATIDSLVFEYYDPAIGGTFSATANLYNDPSGLDLGATRIAGPFTVTSLPRGRKVVAIALPHVATPGSSVWVGVQFSSTTAGLVLKDVPSVGSSHDLYLENGGFYWFGGHPKANFGIRLMGTPRTAAVDDGPSAGLALAPPSPNPFRRGTTLSFTLARGGPVQLDVIDLSGRRVRALVDDTRVAGNYAVTWSGTDDLGRMVEAGVYFVRLRSGARAMERKVALVR